MKRKETSRGIPLGASTKDVVAAWATVLAVAAVLILVQVLP
jgi:hypothetical protein